MNILLVAPTSDFSSQVHDALISLGNSVSVIDDRLDYGLPSFLRSNRTLWRLSRRWPWWRARANAALQKRILAKASGSAFPLLLALKGMNVKPQTLSVLRDRGVTTACWCIDNAANEPYASWVAKVGPQWNHFFSFDSAIHRQMTAMSGQVHVLPLAVNPDVYAVTPTNEDRRRYACQVCFIGAPYPDRVKLLEKLATYDLKIWGWSGWAKTSLAKYWQGPLNAQESAKAYQCAAVSINTNVLPHADGVNLKTFEIPAAGGFELTDHPKDLEDSFIIGSELDVFTDASDAHAKVQYWLDHAQERKEAARAGQARVQRDHSMMVRMKVLLDTITL